MAEAKHEITIHRTQVGKGRLKYSNGTSIEADCWWDSSEPIPGKVYRACSATHMASKKNSAGQPREAIFIPQVPGRQGIFIHYWSGESANLSAWSDGCIVVREHVIKKIWHQIKKQSGLNSKDVVVRVK